MQYIVAIIVIGMVLKAMGWVAWVLVGGGALVGLAGWIISMVEEANLPPEVKEARVREQEERRARRRAQMDEERHHERMLAIRRQQMEEQQKASNKSAILGTVGKVAVGLIIQHYTGQNHHKH